MAPVLNWSTFFGIQNEWLWTFIDEEVIEEECDDSQNAVVHFAGSPPVQSQSVGCFTTSHVGYLFHFIVVKCTRCF